MSKKKLVECDHRDMRINYGHLPLAFTYECVCGIHDIVYLESGSLVCENCECPEEDCECNLDE